MDQFARIHPHRRVLQDFMESSAVSQKPSCSLSVRSIACILTLSDLPSARLTSGIVAGSVGLLAILATVFGFWLHINEVLEKDAFEDTGTKIGKSIQNAIAIFTIVVETLQLAVRIAATSKRLVTVACAGLCDDKCCTALGCDNQQHCHSNSFCFHLRFRGSLCAHLVLCCYHLFGVCSCVDCTVAQGCTT